MFNDGLGYIIDEKEIPICKEMFKEVCPAMEIVKTRFSTNLYTSDEMFVIVAKYIGSEEKESFRFILDEEDGIFTITMYDSFYDVCNEREISKDDVSNYYDSFHLEQIKEMAQRG